MNIVKKYPNVIVLALCLAAFAAFAVSHLRTAQAEKREDARRSRRTSRAIDAAGGTKEWHAMRDAAWRADRLREKIVYSVSVYLKDGKMYRWPHPGEMTEESERLIGDVRPY